MFSGMVAELDDGTGVTGAGRWHQTGDPGAVSQSLEYRGHNPENRASGNVAGRRLVFRLWVGKHKI